MVPDSSSSTSRRAVLGAGLSVAAGGLSSTLLAASGDAQSTSSSESASTFTDWPLERYDPAGTGYNPDVAGPSESVRVKWRAELDDFRGGRASPILVDDTVYVVGTGVAALDAGDGSVEYHHEGPYQSGPALASAEAYTSDTLVVAGSQGYIGLNARGGADLFGRQLGFERWYQGGDPPEFYTFGAPPTASPPVVVDGVVYVADAATDRLAALDPSSGRELWATEVGRENASGQPGRPAVHDGTVYVGWWPHGAEAYDAETGERRWQQEVDGDVVCSPTATDERILFPDTTGVTALDPEEGTEQWRFDHGGNVTNAGAVAVADGTMFVVSDTEAQLLHAVDVTTGEAKWQTEGVAREATPVVADGVVYLASGGHDLVAVDAETGALNWRFETEWGVGTPAVSDGILFVSGAYRDVYALEAGR